MNEVTLCTWSPCSLFCNHRVTFSFPRATGCGAKTPGPLESSRTKMKSWPRHVLAVHVGQGAYCLWASASVIVEEGWYNPYYKTVVKIRDHVYKSSWLVVNVLSDRIKAIAPLSVGPYLCWNLVVLTDFTLTLCFFFVKPKRFFPLSWGIWVAGLASWQDVVGQTKTLLVVFLVRRLPWPV